MSHYFVDVCSIGVSIAVGDELRKPDALRFRKEIVISREGGSYGVDDAALVR